jgi:hypothetical protein
VQDHNKSVRRFPRYRTELSLTLASPLRQGELHGICCQISEGGVTVIVSAELSIAEIVSLQFTIPPDSQPSTLKAIVRWRDRLQHGLEFWNISQEHQNKVKLVCDDLRKKGRLVSPPEY